MSDAGFNVSGFHREKAVLNKAVLQNLSTRITSFLDEEMATTGLVVDARREEGSLDRVFNIQDVIPEVRSLWEDSALLAIGADLLQVERVVPFYTQTIMKYPSPTPKRGVIGWHTDFAYWEGAGAPRLVTAWIPFAAVRAESGGLRYVLGSHQKAQLRAGFNNPDMTSSQATAEAHAEVGDVLFHHCLTMHGSAENTSAAPRLALAVHLIDRSLVPVDLGRCHHSLAWLAGSEPVVAH